MKSKFKMVAMAACAVVGGGLSADVVHEVAGGQSQNIPLINTSERVIFKGGGTFVLQDGNTFGGDVVVSNGVLSADYQASGLAATHLSLVGTGNGNTSLAILRPKGATFTADVASSGAGTVSFERYAGLSPNDQTLTVNLGGDERVLKHKTDGFMTSEFILGFSNQHDLIFKNGIDLNGNNFTLKNPGSTKPTFFDGIVTNSMTGTQARELNYWDGTTIFRGQPGRVDIYYKKDCKWRQHNGTLVFSNCTIRAYNDYYSGPQYLATTIYGGTCDRIFTSGFEVLNGATGTKTLIDGVNYDNRNLLSIGYSDNADWEGNFIVTNNAAANLAGLCVHNGSFNQMSGTVSLQTESTHSYDNPVVVGGFNWPYDTAHNGRGQSLYNLYDGEFVIRNHAGWRQMSIGAAEQGWFNQFGGTATIARELSLGGWTAGIGFLNVHGGVFTKTWDGPMTVGRNGKGVMSVANGGRFTCAYANGVKIGDSASGNGLLAFDPDGVLEASRIYSGSGINATVFNGGTLRVNNTKYAAGNVVDVTGDIGVSVLGGAIDTNGKGDFAIGKGIIGKEPLLTHRWTFANGSLVDDVGGVTAETVGGGVTVSDGSVRLSGGANGTSQIKLGKGLIGTAIGGWTCEMEFTQKGNVWNTPLIQCNVDKYNSFSVNINKWSGWGVIACGKEFSGKYTPVSNVPYLVSFSIEPGYMGCWKITASLHNAETGELCEEVSGMTSGRWQLKHFNASSEIWIGKNAWNDASPNIEIREVRMYDRAFTSVERNRRAEVVANGVRYFTKKGEGMLTLTGANTYKAGTAVEGGTLKLAAGATLPATPIKACAGAVLDLTNQGTTQEASRLEGAGTIRGGAIAVTDAIKPGDATGVGTLTVDGTDITASKFVATIGEDGTTCGLLSGAGTLDASGLTVELANPEALVRGTVYHLVSGLAVSGKAAAGESIPKRWSVVTSQTGIKLVNAGFAIILK